MDQAFMENYFEMAYDDVVREMTANDGGYAELEKEFKKTQEEFSQMVGGTSSPVWQKFEDVMAAHYNMDLALIKDAYLTGAEDREKMLR